MHKFLRNDALGVARICRSRVLVRWLLAVALLASGGCAAMTNPVGDGVRVRHLPPELLAPSKQGEQTLPLNTLRQPPVSTYRLAPGDVLGVYVETILGDRNQPFPLHVSAPVQIK